MGYFFITVAIAPTLEPAHIQIENGGLNVASRVAADRLRSAGLVSESANLNTPESAWTYAVSVPVVICTGSSVSVIRSVVI